MIKAEELMLGDWLKYGIDRIVKVTALYGSMVETNVVTPLFPDDLEPIPITLEILEKNGFESVKNIFGLKTYKLNDDFILEDRGEEKCLCRGCYKIQPSSTFWVCNIEHVHELQHALKLCGISKNIEL